MRLPDREQVDEAAAPHVDQVLGEEEVAERDRAATEPEEREVGGLAGALAEYPVEAADLIGGVAARRRQDADPRPAAGALRGQPQHQLAHRSVRRARGEVVTAEGQDAGDHRRYAAAAVEIASGTGPVGSIRASPR